MVDAIGRVSEIQSLVASIAAGGATQAASAADASSTTDFSGSLDAATAARTTPSATAASAALPTGLTTGSTPALPSTGDGAVPANLQPLIADAANANGLDPALVAAVTRAESGFRVDAGSPAGAQGLMQLMPSTAAGLGVTDIHDAAQNLGAGSRYLKQQIERFGDLRLALAAYNAGPGAVSRYGGVPPYAETQAYVDRVLGYYEQYRGTSAATA
ncbi:MAG: lytic transglycosylase domain-containing protein [Thermoleophilia bacterium]|nr:lytic transglycosylase domain-containing protein [Thermoleophilia bacterium]